MNFNKLKNKLLKRNRKLDFCTPDPDSSFEIIQDGDWHTLDITKYSSKEAPGICILTYSTVADPWKKKDRIIFRPPGEIHMMKRFYAYAPFLYRQRFYANIMFNPGSKAIEYKVEGRIEGLVVAIHGYWA